MAGWHIRAWGRNWCRGHVGECYWLTLRCCPHAVVVLDRVALCRFGYPRTHCVDQAGSQFIEIHLSLPLPCWDQMCAPPTSSPASYLIQLRITCQEMESPYTGQLAKMVITYKHTHRPIWFRQFLRGSFSQMTLGCVISMFKLIRTHEAQTQFPQMLLSEIGWLHRRGVLYIETSYGGLYEFSSPRAHSSYQQRWGLNPACQLQNPLFLHDHMLISQSFSCLQA